MLDGHSPEQLRCVALIICNEVIEDRRTNNKTLVNVFNTVASGQLPAVQPKMVLLISITNAMGHHELTVNLTDPEGGRVLSVNLHLTSQSILITHDMVLELLTIPLNYAGSYSFEVFSEGQLLGSRQFDVSYQPAEANG